MLDYQVSRDYFESWEKQDGWLKQGTTSQFNMILLGYNSGKKIFLWSPLLKKQKSQISDSAWIRGGNKRQLLTSERPRIEFER